MQHFHAPLSRTFASIDRFFMHSFLACAALAPQHFQSHSALTPLTLVLAPCYPARIARRVLASAFAFEHFAADCTVRRHRSSHIVMRSAVEAPERIEWRFRAILQEQR